ncbi:hypothetical protein ABBQ32_011395 [Trebouxia sp. C0010 RCD-2024]
MSGKGQTSKTGEQGGVLDSVKEAGKTISNEISKTTGGSQVLDTAQFAAAQMHRKQDLAGCNDNIQVGDVVQEKESGGAKKVAKE